MDPFWTLATLTFLVAVIVLLGGLPKNTSAHLWPSWDLALSPQAPDRRQHDEYAADLHDELGAFDSTLHLARANVDQGDLGEAARVIRLAARHVVRHVPTLYRRLEVWRDAVRAVSAVHPLPRLRVFAFRLWRLRGVAAGESAARLALDTAHRFALRVWVVLLGLRVVLRGFARAAPEGPPEPAALERALSRLETLGHDLGTLHGASLQVYRALLISRHGPRGKHATRSE